MARPLWKGYIKLALVSCPVALYPATSATERVAFRQMNKRTGHRIRHESVDEVTREPVDVKDRGRGYEYDKDQYLLVDDEELKRIEIESTKMIDIDAFVPRAEIDERYLDSPYYIAPHEPVGAEAFAVIREAMRDKAMAALARVVLANRERVVMLQPWGKGMLATTVRYPYELRDADEYFRDIPDVKIDPTLLKLAEHILQSKTAAFDPGRFVDRYERAVVDLLEAKRRGLPASPAQGVTTPRTSFDLMDALKRSLGVGAPLAPANDASARAKRAKPPKRAAAGQREMLLPIAGKRAAEPKADAKPAARRKAG